MALDLKRMERDILEAAHILGKIGSISNPYTPASEFLLKKYESDEEMEQLYVVTCNTL